MLIKKQKDKGYLVSYTDLYNQLLMDYYRYPRNKGTLEKPDFVSGVYNPLCGDEVTLCGTLDGDIITQCLFQAKGCVISQASASLVAEYTMNKSIQTVMALTKNDLLAIIKLELGPTRLRCALISLEALHNGLKSLKLS